MLKNILVIGSLNVDLMVQVDELPVPGQTLTSRSFEILPGGKGMNQAVCAAKLGANVTMAGCIGNDSYGELLMKTLEENQINSKHIRTMPGKPTGTAIVTTSPKDNNIIVVPGANACVDRQYIDSIHEVIKQADLVIVQLEIPLDTVYYVIDICHKENIAVILNPAPAHEIDKTYIEKVNYFIPNETELVSIFNEDFKTILARYPNKIIMSAGENGAYFHDGTELVNCKARNVKVVDTTGAGDAFNGALAVSVLAGKDLRSAVDYANGIAAITTTVKGAQGADADRYKRSI